MPLTGMGGWKDVHSGTLCRDTTRGDGGRAEPPGGRKAVWRSSQHDFEDAAVFCPAGLSAAGAAGGEEARSPTWLGSTRVTHDGDVVGAAESRDPPQWRHLWGSAYHFRADQFEALFTSINPRVGALGKIFKNASVRTSARSSDTAVTWSGKQATTSSS